MKAVRPARLQDLILVVALALLPIACTSQASRPAAEAAKPPSPRDEMRMPWTAASGGFLRSWLVVGEFPNPPHDGAATYDHTPPCVGLDTDYLKEQGGEAAVRPVAGMKVKRPDGSTAAWAAVTSKEDAIDLAACFAGRPTQNVVAYAYTTITSPRERPAILAVGSDDGVRLRLNGKVVHEILLSRAVVPDQDLVPVTLQAGENTLLVKVEQGTGGWGFCLRVLSPEQAASVRGGDIAPALLPDADAGTLAVKTDRAAPAAGAEAAPVKVEVVAAGGPVVASQTAPRGQAVRFATKDWADGPYEVRCTTATPVGRRDVKHLPWYKGDALAAARRLVETAARADRSTPEGMLHAMLAEMVLDRAGGSLEKVTGPAWPRFHSALMEFAELEQLRPGAKGDGKGPVRPYGFVRLAYRDDIDDSPQFCRCYLPADYDPAKRWPLVVNLHGYHSANPPYVRWWSVDQRHNRMADLAGLIEIEPLGRYNTSYLGIGDRDVMRCVEMAKRRFNVDEDRVYLMGYSMGGGGTWHVGTRHTDVFAAIAPVYGGWDYHIWLDEKAWPKLTDGGRLRFERESSFVGAENLLSTPVFVNHGDADVLVNVDFSRYIVRMLQRWGYDVRYWEHPGGGHGPLGCEDAIAEWFLAHPRQAFPPQVRLRAPDLASARAQWAAVTARKDPLDLIRADVEVLGPNFIRLDTDNALEVALAPGGPLIDPAKPVRVIWNGTDARQVMMKDGRISLQALGYKAGLLTKRPGLEGPISAATQTPFAVVVGTISPDALMRRLCERAAENFAAGWQTRQHCRPRFFKDTEISQDDMARYTLLLFGGPDANAVTKAFADKLPVRISADEAAVDGRTFKAADAAVQFVYPNPLNPDRLVLVTAGTSAQGMFLADRLPDDVDFAIADARVPDADAGRPPEKVVIAAGYFDSAWQLTDAHLDLGNPAIRAKCPVRKVPAHADGNVPAARLPLSNVVDAAAEGSFGNMQRDLNWNGKPIRLGGKTYASGLGVACRHETCGADWQIAGGRWRRLRATLGIEIDDPAKLEPKHKENTRVVFIVKGDGKELFRSPPFRWDSRPAELDVDVTGVKVLRLEVANETKWFCAASSVDWADARLEK